MKQQATIAEMGTTLAAEVARAAEVQDELMHRGIERNLAEA